MAEAATKTAGDKSKGLKLREPKIIESPTPMIRIALTVRCSISVKLKPNFVRRRGGVYETLNS